jgi:hypothetical protein
MSETDTNLMVTATVETIPSSSTTTNDQQDSTNSTLTKSSSISQSTSYSSIKSDDEFPSQTEQKIVNTSDQLAEDKKKPAAPKAQRVNITLGKLNLIPPHSSTANSTTTATAKRPTTTRYTKEFLEKVRKERSKFIDKICPDIFRAYCYCMNGKYWNPEKYFDVVQHQFPEELDKIKRFNNNTTNQKPYIPQQKPYQQHKNRKLVNNNQQPSQQKQPQPQEQRENAGKIILDLIKPKQSESILDKILPPKTPERPSSTQQQKQKSTLPALFTAPAPPPPTPATNLLDMLHAAKHNNEQSTNTAAYKNLIDLFNKDSSKGKPKTTTTGDSSLKNENLIKKLFDHGSSSSSSGKTTEPAKTTFPTMNPHELPFQSIDYALNQILKSSSQSEASSSSSSAPSTSNSTSASNSVPSSNNTSPHKVFDSLIEKLKNADVQKQQQQNTEHFNLLLSKIQPQQQEQQQNDILKWFKQPTVSPQQPQFVGLPKNAHVFALRDIESAF